MPTEPAVRLGLFLGIVQYFAAHDIGRTRVAIEAGDVFLLHPYPIDPELAFALFRRTLVDAACVVPINWRIGEENAKPAVCTEPLKSRVAELDITVTNLDSRKTRRQCSALEVTSAA
jgi:hypothetical protein